MIDKKMLPSIIETISRATADQAVHRVISGLRDEGDAFTAEDMYDACRIATAMAMEQFATIVKTEVAIIQMNERRRLDLAALTPPKLDLNLIGGVGGAWPAPPHRE